MNSKLLQPVAKEVASSLLFHPRARVEEVFLFGSLARDQANANDIDILAVIDEERWRLYKMRYIAHTKDLGSRFTLIHKLGIACESLEIRTSDALYRSLFQTEVAVDLTLLPSYWRFRSDIVKEMGFSEDLATKARKFDPLKNVFLPR